MFVRRKYGQPYGQRDSGMNGQTDWISRDRSIGGYTGRYRREGDWRWINKLVLYGYMEGWISKSASTQGRDKEMIISSPCDPFEMAGSPVADPCYEDHPTESTGAFHAGNGNGGGIINDY